MTDADCADKITHPQHFGTDPTDTRIRINPKIRIRIPCVIPSFWITDERRNERLPKFAGMGKG